MTVLKLWLAGIGPGIDLIDQLAARRLKLDMTVTELASRSGLSRRTIVGIEQRRGSVASLLRLIAVVAPNARRRAAERSYWGRGDKLERDSRFTPPEFLSNIYAAFGELDLDPCANRASPVLARRFILPDEGDGLTDDWSGRLVFVNPPFSELMQWLRHAYDQWRSGKVETVVCLAPVRTDSKLFHETLSADADIYLLRGRVRFLDSRGNGQHTPFSLMLLTLGASEEQKAHYAALVPGFWIAPASRRSQSG